MQRPIAKRVSGSFWLVFVLLGCSESSDRPPVHPGCTGDVCASPGGGGIAPPDATGGTAGDGGNGFGDSIPLSGSVVQYTEDQFVQVSQFTGPGTVQVLGAGDIPVEGAFEGGQFSLPEVQVAGPATWAFVEPASVALHFPTWSRVALAPDVPATVPVVMRSVVEEIMNVLAIPTLPEPGTAQVIVRIEDAQGAGVEGVTVSALAAQSVIYSAFGTWSDTEPFTDGRGFAVLGNVAASPMPGNEMALTLGGAASGQYLARASNDAVSFVRIELGQPPEEEDF